jgi:hypothetical protein
MRVRTGEGGLTNSPETGLSADGSFAVLDKSHQTENFLSGQGRVNDRVSQTFHSPLAEYSGICDKVILAASTGVPPKTLTVPR